MSACRKKLLSVGASNIYDECEGQCTMKDDQRLPATGDGRLRIKHPILIVINSSVAIFSDFARIPIFRGLPLNISGFSSLHPICLVLLIILVVSLSKLNYY